MDESINLGIFPDKLKYAIVIPIHKKGAHTDLSNYQPIFLLSVFSKICEKSMFRRLYEYLDNLNTFYHLQFGLREKHSTNHLMISITESIKKIIDNGNYGFGVFIDLKEVLNTVNHPILLKKLKHYGIIGIAVNWFTFYLFNKKNNISLSVDILLNV